MVCCCLVGLVACRKEGISDEIDLRGEMRGFVRGLAGYARERDANFVVIPQNGIALISLDGEVDGPPASDYLNSIDGVGQESLWYGYAGDDEKSPTEERDYTKAWLDAARGHGVRVLVTDYCSTRSKMDDAKRRNGEAGFLSFAAPDRELRVVPDYPGLQGENAGVIGSLDDAKNFLYLINDERHSEKGSLIAAIAGTNYDVVIMDAFFQDKIAFTRAEVDALRMKANGGQRLVIAYMSIGEAEEYRIYWQKNWRRGAPVWLEYVNPDWAGNHKVKYWYPEWQGVIYGGEGSYLDGILDAGFDGVYLDIIDAFEYFEYRGGVVSSQ